MKFQTISLVAGTPACNAACPFCVSRMTGDAGLTAKPTAIDVRNLDKALRLAEIGGATTAIITGKGEPLLVPSHVQQYLMHLRQYRIPLVELQTNALRLAADRIGDQDTDELLRCFADAGLTTVLISVVGDDPDLNARIYTGGKPYPDLARTVARIRRAGIQVRFTCVGIAGGVDTPATLDRFVDWAGGIGASQVTWRPVAKPDGARDAGASAWVMAHGLDGAAIGRIRDHVESTATRLYGLVHGAAVYDHRGRNLCLSNCLTVGTADDDAVRQIIFFPNGEVRTDWQHDGSVVLAGR